MAKSMKLILFLMFFLCNFLYAETITVWNLKASSEVTKEELESLNAGFLKAVQENAGNDTIISEPEMMSRISDENMKISCGAEDTFCISQISWFMSAQFSVSGTVSKSEDLSYMIELFLIDIDKASVKSKISKKIYGNPEQIKFQFSGSFCELMGRKDCQQGKPVLNVEPSNEFKNEIAETKNEKPIKAKPGQKEPETDISWQKITGWSLFGVGLGIVGGLGIGGYYAMKSEDDYSSYYAWSGVSTAGYVTGSAAIITGLSFIIWDAVDRKRTERNVSFQLVPAKDSFVIVFSGAWK